MRDIKFRAWEKARKRMIYRDLFDRDWYDKEDLSVGSALPEDRTRVEIMQYTGLKDKNGVEIYEGDIVRNYQDKLWVIAWNDGYAAFGKRDPELGVNSQPISNMHPVKQDEVIGNIYENAELLNV